MSKKYPAAVPVFEVTIDNGEVLPRGAHFEATCIVRRGYNTPDYPQYFATQSGIGGRVLDESQIRWHTSRHPTQGWASIVAQLGHCRPLTRAAREMLAAAKAELT